MRQQLALESSQVGAGLEPRGVGQHPPGLLEGPQRIGLPADAVEREREQALQALVERVLVDGPLERYESSGMVTQRQSGLGGRAGCHGREAVEMGGGVDHERLVGQFGQQRAPTQLVGLLEIGQARLRRPAPEVVASEPDQVLVVEQVEVRPVDRQPVPRWLGDQHRGRVTGSTVGLEHVAQSGDVGLQSPEAARIAVPQQLDQAICRHDLVGFEQQQGQHRTLLRWTGIDPVVADP